jgi:hypothetical protein
MLADERTQPDIQALVLYTSSKEKKIKIWIYIIYSLERNITLSKFHIKDRVPRNLKEFCDLRAHVVSFAHDQM